MDSTAETPERGEQSSSLKSPRVLFDVDDTHGSQNLSLSSSEISSSPSSVCTVRNLTKNFSKMLLNQTPPKYAHDSFGPRESPLVNKETSPLPGNDSSIKVKQFYGKTCAVQEGERIDILAAARNWVSEVQSNSTFHEASSSVTSSRTAPHVARPLKRAKTDSAKNFFENKSPPTKKKKIFKSAPKRKARDELDSGVPFKKIVTGTMTRAKLKLLNAEFSNPNCQLSNRQTASLTSPRTNSRARQILQEEQNIKLPDPPNDNQEQFGNDKVNPGNTGMPCLLEKLDDDEAKENACDLTVTNADPNKPVSACSTNESSLSSTHSPGETKKYRRTTFGDVKSPSAANQLLPNAKQFKLREIETERYELCSCCEREDGIIPYHRAKITQMSFNGFKNERIVEVIGEDRILLVKETDPIAWKRKVISLMSSINGELGFLTDGFPQQVYMYVKNKRVVGLLLAQNLVSGFRLLPFNIASGSSDALNDDSFICSDVSCPTKCGVSRLWVAQKERRRGVASALVDALRTNFSSTCLLSVNDIAFWAPSADENKFARKYCNRNDFLVYI